MQTSKIFLGDTDTMAAFAGDLAGLIYLCL
jgi:hypothetical protein